MSSKPGPTRTQAQKQLHYQNIHVQLSNNTNKGMERQIKPITPKVNPREYNNNGSPFPNSYMRPLYSR